MKKITSLAIILLLLGLLLVFNTKNIEAESHRGITMTMTTPGETQDEIKFSFDAYTLESNHIGFKVNPVYGIKSGSRVKWQGFRIYVYDSSNNEYAFTQIGITLNDGVNMPSIDESGNLSSVSSGNGYIYPLVETFETVYMPYENFVSTKGTTLKKGMEITAVKIKYDTREGQREEAVNNIFGLYDGNLSKEDMTESKTDWIGDVYVQCDFDIKKDEYTYLGAREITNFGNYEIGGEKISFNKGCVTKLSYLKEEEYQKLLSMKVDTYKSWRSDFIYNGQKFNSTPLDHGEYKEGLLWEYGDYSEEYDSTQNSYGSIQLNVKTTDWSDALGITLYVKNYQPYPSSFNVEFNEVESGGVERWNLNSEFYSKIYAYDVNTGEEYAFHTLNVCVIPANFEGWIRIPFSEFNCPSWSAAYAHTDAIMDLNKQHNSIYITSQFVKNDGAMFLFDNVGLYYSDFQVGKLFDRTKLSIKECLELSYKVD